MLNQGIYQGVESKEDELREMKHDNGKTDSDVNKSDEMEMEQSAFYSNLTY